MKGEFRRLPSVDRVMRDNRIASLTQAHSRALLIEAAREVLEETRDRIADGKQCPPFEEIVDHVVTRASAACTPSLRPVINATGVIIHTNLGRAPLSRQAAEAMVEATTSYSNLEFELETGKRGSRHAHVEDLLVRVTGAEAGFAVNNNAAALLLALSTLARSKEAILSRSQSVEIGGGFRVPDVMRQSGARLMEVGTTNRTYLSDYEAAMSQRTGVLLRVHSSNYRITGFTHFASLPELVELGRRYGVAVLDDLGSGALLDTARFGMAHEPMVQESVAAGADVICFSGDKLLGGPQAGLIVGKKQHIDRLKKHPLARAVRLDKATIAGLCATLMHYVDGDATATIPVWQMIARPIVDVEEQANLWRSRLVELDAELAVVDGHSTVGGGSLPDEVLPTRLLAIRPMFATRSVGSSDPTGGGRPRSMSVGEIAERLRRGAPPVIARVERGALLLDPRTVFREQDELLVRAVQLAFAGSG